MKVSQGFTREYYDRLCIWGSNYWNDVQEERARTTVLMLPNDVHSVLDIGCGAGIVTKEIKCRIPIVVALDLAITPLMQLNKTRDIHCIQSECSVLPFRDKSFDAVVATELIEHLSATSRKLTLKEIARVSKKYILLTVPYKEVLESAQVKCGECGCIFHAYRHTKSFDKREIEFLFYPNFILVENKTFGPRSKKIPRSLYILAQIFGGYMKPATKIVMCPQCGNSDNYVSRRNLMTRLLLDIPFRFLPLPKRHSWIAALYENQRSL